MSTRGEGESPDAGDLARFRSELRDLHAAVLSPTYAALAAGAAFRGQALPTSTTSNLLASARRPSWRTVESFVLACERYWRTLPEPRPQLKRDAFDLPSWNRRYRQLRSPAGHPPGPGQPGPGGWPRQFGTPPLLAHCFRDRADDAAYHLSAGGICRILHGLAGAGKTQLAAGWAQALRERGEVDLVVWLNATTRDQIVAGYAQAAREVSATDDPSAERAAGRFLAWMGRTDLRWLVVLDDLAAPGDLVDLWPPSAPTGRTVVTTQRNDAALAGSGRQFIEVTQFVPSDALGFLAAWLADHPDLLAGAEELAAALGYLPIALAQAAVYLLDRRLTCAEYCARLASRRLEQVLPEKRWLPDTQKDVIPAIWSLSVDRANDLEPTGLAQPALELASVLAASGIPKEVFRTPDAVGHLRASRSSGVPVDADDARDALHSLHRLNLVSLEPGLVRVHTLVQRATRDRLPAPRFQQVVRAAADALLAVWPVTEPEARQALLMRANAFAVASHDGGLLRREGIHPLLIRAGQSLAESGDVGAAAAYFRQLRDTADPALGAREPHLLRIRHYLAYCRGEGGDPAGAAVDAAAVAAACIRVLGRDHRDTLIALVYLARWQGLGGNPGRAARRLRGLVPRLTRVLGDADPNTLTARNDLAHFQGQAGDVAAAVGALKNLLADRVRLLGADHPHTLTTRNDLAFWTGEAGDKATAATAFEILVHDLARVLGPDHPRTLAARGSAARLHGEAGDTAAAVAGLTQVLADFRRAHGAEHPFTRRTEELLDRARQAAGG
jgi:hypothetical protein